MEHDVRCDADNIGGQHQPEELPILRRRRQFRTAHGLHAGRKGQTDGQFEGDPGTARGDGDEARRGREGARLPPKADQRQPPPGRLNRLYYRHFISRVSKTRLPGAPEVAQSRRP